ncbi:MAG: DMT family transporter [Clostridia bacterium]|nr:DMT family transporter [Clostridia bacterium]
MKKIPPRFVVLIGILGISFSAIFVNLADAPSAVLVFFRMAITSLLLLPGILKKERREEFRAMPKKTWLLCILAGVTFALHLTTTFESFRLTSIASSTVLVNLEVFFVALVARLLFKERIPLLGKFGILAAFVGSVVIAMGDHAAGGSALLGDILGLVAAMSMSCSTLIARKVRVHISTSVYTFLMYSTCAVTILIFCLVTAEPLATGLSTRNLLCALGMAIFCTLMGHSVFNWGLKYLPTAYISTLKLGEPLGATILALLIFHEVPGLVQGIGAIIIIAGLVLYVRVSENRPQLNETISS